MVRDSSEPALGREPAVLSRPAPTVIFMPLTEITRWPSPVMRSSAVGPAGRPSPSNWVGRHSHQSPARLGGGVISDDQRNPSTTASLGSCQPFTNKARIFL